jgi:exonuclease SbcC
VRPLALRVRGLQSYRETVEVDFAELGAYGLFGIFGPVGAGKSTLLDAITLALFGVVDRLQGRSRRGIVHSGSERAEVCFQFSMREGDADVVWSVERHYRVDSDGGALRVASRLMRRDTGEVVADKERDVADAVHSLIGLTAEDFLRAVVLPQGRFMELLHLRGDARRQLPQRLFGLERFGDDLRQRLRSREVALEQAMKRGEGELAGLGDLPDDALAQAEAEVARAEERRESARRERDRAASTQALADAVAAAEARVATATEAWEATRRLEADAAVRRDRLARARLDVALAEPRRRLSEAGRAEAVARDDDRLAAGEAERARTNAAAAAARQRTAAEALDDQGPVWRALIARLAVEEEHREKREAALRASRAARLAVEKAQRAATEATAARARADDRVLEAQKARDAWAQRWADAEVDAEERARAQSASLVLAEAEAANRRVAEVRSRVSREADEQKAAARAWQEAEALAGELRARLAQVPEPEPVDEPHADLEALDRDRAGAEAAAAARALAEAEAKRARTEAAEVSARVARRRTIHREAETALRQAEADAARAGAAARCAQDLVAGRACPACGSLHHPAPAPPPDPILASAVAAHQSGRARALERLDEALEVEARARAAAAVSESVAVRAFAIESECGIRLAERRPSTAPPGSGPDDWRVTLVARIARAQAARESARDRAELCAAIARADAPLPALRSRLEAAEDRLGRAQADADLAEAASTRAWARLSEEWPDAPIFELLRRGRTEPDGEGATDLREGLAEADHALATARRERDRAAREEMKRREAAAQATGRVEAAPDEEAVEADRSALPRAREALAALERERDEAATAERNAADLLRIRVAEAAEARASWAAAEAVRTDREGAFAAALAHAGLSVDPGPIDEHADGDAVATLEADVAAFDDASRRAARALADARSDRAALGPAPPAVEARAAADEAARRFEDAVGEAASRTAERDAVSHRAPRSRALRQEVAAVRARLDVARTLAGLLRANRFVDWLAEDALGDLVARASVHLRGLTDDRYGLGLDDDATFVVSDADFGGAVRPVASLSGGETFLASLGLALALSEQVAARGRRPLDFFFLDEGFGSLDAAALDRAMSAIEALPRGDRLVGVVSHVPGVRERVPRWLEVQPATREEGARVRIVDG